MTFYGNYGRGIASPDARGVIRNPDAPKISTTDFYQTELPTTRGVFRRRAVSFSLTVERAGLHSRRRLNRIRRTLALLRH
jgi:hypothetical protein